MATQGTRTLEVARQELNARIPHLDSRWDLLEEIVDHMDLVWPNETQRTQSFRMCFGIRIRPMVFAEIAKRLKISIGTVSKNRNRILKRLQDSRWWDKNQWPEPMGTIKRANISQTRVNEICERLQMLEYQSKGTARFEKELLKAAEVLGIAEEEMRQFILAIRDRVMQRTQRGKKKKK